MEVNTGTLIIFTLLLLVYLEHLLTTTNRRLLQNLTSTIGNILQNQLKIHIVHDYHNCSLETSRPDKLSSTSTTKLARDCNDIMAQGHDTSGVYTIKPQIHPVAQGEANEMQFTVYCDLENDGGGWTVFQRREDESVDFYLGWEDYKQGFGYFESEFWLGLERLHRLTTQAHYELLVNLEDASGDKRYAKYDKFRVGDESTSYKLILGDHEGTVTDSLTAEVNRPFSTKDRDNDAYSQNCAYNYKGGWWYNACYHSNLNGLFKEPGEVNPAGVVWYNWKNTHESLKSTEMKIRRTQ